MSKILEASCVGNVVSIEGAPVEAEILSEGVGSSTGCALMEKEKIFYITSNASDLKTTLEKAVSAIEKISAALLAIGAGMTGPTTTPPPTLAADVAEILVISVELQTLSAGLK